MEQKVLEATARTERGSAAARRFRREGRIPAVVYGHKEPIAISLSARDFSRLFTVVSENTLIDLQVDGESHPVLVKDYQSHPLTRAVSHIDFYEIERGKELRTHVPVHVHGSPIGVRSGGILEHGIHEVEVECLPKDLPEDYRLDISQLNTGESLHVSDLPALEGVRVLSSAEQVIVAVAHPRVEATESEEEEAEETAESTEG